MKPKITKFFDKIFDVPTLGTKRIVKKFLILPKSINEETRWLEKVSIEQEIVRAFQYCGKWINRKFVD